MFGKKDRNSQFSSGGHTLFDHALEIRGSIRFAGELDIEGTVIGDIEADDGAEALVNVHDRGVVEGQISAPRVIINGHVRGNIHASKHIELSAKAVVNGDVHYQVIEMVKGAQVNGSMVHVDDSETNKSASATELHPVDIETIKKVSASSKTIK